MIRHHMFQNVMAELALVLVNLAGVDGGGKGGGFEEIWGDL